MGHKAILLAVSVVIGGSLASSALADQGGGLPTLNDRVSGLENETAALQAELAVLEAQLAALQTRRPLVHTRKASLSVPPKSFALVEIHPLEQSAKAGVRTKRVPGDILQAAVHHPRELGGDAQAERRQVHRPVVQDGVEDRYYRQDTLLVRGRQTVQDLDGDLDG